MHAAFPPATSSCLIAITPASATATPSAGKRRRQVGLTPTQPATPVINDGASTNPLHQWLSAKQLNQLETRRGVVVRKGRFSQAEDALLKAAVESFLTERGLIQDDLLQLMAKKRTRDFNVDEPLRKEFWPIIASNFPDRPLNSIYHRLHRLYTQQEEVGAWTDDETQHMFALIQQFGKDWHKIGSMLGRPSENCRSRFRAVQGTHRVHQDAPNRVRWSSEDLKALVNCVLQFALGRDDDDQTLSVADLAAVLERKGLSWVTISNAYNQRAGSFPRNDVCCCSKWKIIVPVIRRNMDMAIANDGLQLGQQITFEDVFLLAVSRSLARLWSRDQDLLLLRRYVHLKERLIFRGRHLLQASWWHFHCQRVKADARRTAKFIVPQQCAFTLLDCTMDMFCYNLFLSLSGA